MKRYTRFIAILLLVWPFSLVASENAYKGANLQPSKILGSGDIPFPTQLRRYAVAYNIKPSLLYATIYCESRFYADAVGVNKDESVDYGFLQVNSRHSYAAQEKGLDLTIPDESFLYGLELMKKNGILPWVQKTRKCIGSFVPPMWTFSS